MLSMLLGTCIRTSRNSAGAVVFPCSSSAAHSLLAFSFNAATHLVVVPGELVKFVVPFVRGQYVRTYQPVQKPLYVVCVCEFVCVHEHEKQSKCMQQT